MVDSGYRPPLSLLLDGGADFDAGGALEEFRRALGGNLVAFPAGDVSYAVFGKSVYASTMILGAAWQKGGIPFGIEDMEAALGECFRGADLADNLRAFAIGREIALGGEEKVREFGLGGVDSQIPESLYVESVRESFLPWQGVSARIRAFRRDLDRTAASLPGIPKGDLARYLHDIYVYDGGRGAADFMENAAKLPELYGDGADLARALRTLARTYFIKDEVFVSAAMVSPLKRYRDERLYGRLGGSYRIDPVNRPSFDLWGKKIEFDVSPRPWMLKLMRHARFLRRLLPTWHGEETGIAVRVRRAVMEEVPGSDDRNGRLRDIENVKGFRDIRYAKARAVFGGAGDAA